MPIAKYIRDNNILDSSDFKLVDVFYDIYTLDETKEFELHRLFCEYLSRVPIPLGFGGKAFACQFVVWLCRQNNDQDAARWGYLVDRAREITRRRSGADERHEQAEINDG